MEFQRVSAFKSQDPNLAGDEGRIRCEEGECHAVYASEPYPQGKAVGQGLRGLFEDWREVGALADVYGVRAYGVLRFFAE